MSEFKVLNSPFLQSDSQTRVMQVNGIDRRDWQPLVQRALFTGEGDILFGTVHVNLGGQT